LGRMRAELVGLPLIIPPHRLRDATPAFLWDGTPTPCPAIRDALAALETSWPGAPRLLPCPMPAFETDLSIFPPHALRWLMERTLCAWDHPQTRRRAAAWKALRAKAESRDGFLLYARAKSWTRDDFAETNAALALLLCLSPADAPTIQPPALAHQHPLFWAGPAQRWPHCRSALAISDEAAKLRWAAGEDPFTKAAGERFFWCATSAWDGAVTVAYQSPKGAVATARITRTEDFGASLVEAMETTFATCTQVATEDHLPNPRAAGAPDPADTPPQHVVAEIAADEALGDMAAILERAFRIPSTRPLAQLEGRTLRDLANASTVQASIFSKESFPHQTTVANAMANIAACVADHQLHRRGEPHASDSRRAAVADAWRDRAMNIPLLTIVAPAFEPVWPPWSVATESSTWVDGPIAATEHGLEGSCTVRLRLWKDGSETSEHLVFHNFESDLVGADDTLLSSMSGTTVRLRRRGAPPSDRDFILAMDLVSDDLVALAGQLLEIEPDPAALFSQGGLVSVETLRTHPDHRRQGHARALVETTLRALAAKHRRLGTLVVSLYAPELAFTPGPLAPSDLRLLYLRLTSPARRMFSDSALAQRALGPTARALVFDSGLALNHEETLMVVGITLSE